MRFGASTFIWASPFSDANVDRLADKVAQHGFDVLEICVEDPALVTAEAVSAAAARAGVEVSVCGAFGPDRDVSHEDPDIRRSAGEYLKTCIDIAAAVGSENVSGPMYSATGKTRLLPDEEREQQWNWAVEGIGAAADYAGERGVGLAIEPLNRYETDLVNTNERGVELCKARRARQRGAADRHVPHEHRGEGHRRCDPRRRRLRAQLPRLRERPRRSGQRPCGVGRGASPRFRRSTTTGSW